MTRKKLLGLMLIAGVVAATLSAGPAEKADRTKASKAYSDGHYRDAYDIYRKLALDAKTDPKQVGRDLYMATQSLQQLNRTNEIDDFREAVIKVHKDNWRLLQAAAKNYVQVQSFGYMIAGEFHRGRHRGGGRYANAQARDRVRAMQLMTQAISKAQGKANARELAALYIDYASMLARYRGYNQAWRLQYLTDLSKLPDYEDGYGYYYYRSSSSGAPVHPDGTPVYHSQPKAYDAAKTDGERWRWLLAEAKELDASRAQEVDTTLANFLHQQFGCQTMASYRWYFRRQAVDDKKNESGTYELHTLKQTETIAKLAIGVKRFGLPDEFNFVKVFQQVADGKKGSWAGQAQNTLAQIFENRRQYDTAAGYWRQSIKEYGPGNHDWKQKRLDQIVKNWGHFESSTVQPSGAGKGATVQYRFRNGTKVSLVAREVKLEKLLEDVKAYIKTRPNYLKWEKTNINRIGWRLIQRNQTQYIGDQVAAWDVKLKPRKMHFDKRITITTPLQKAGVYLLTAKMAGGNTSNTLTWLADTVIVKKHLGDRPYYFLSDAVTGAPVAGANVEFFGYRQKHMRNNRYEITVAHFAERSDADGQVIPKPQSIPKQYSWLIIARTKDGRFAHLGFSGFYPNKHYDYEYNRKRAFVITDRPVYRPKHVVKFKAWVRYAKYDRENTSDFANKNFIVRINNPKGEKILEKAFKTDEYGGLNGEYTLPKDATLGRYYLAVREGPHSVGGGQFRVEEYKKPEFEVTIEAPKEPVMLGEKVAATIQAKYYFGAPVTKAKVKYKVLRYDYSANWYPVMYWDWYYGPGYWWYAYDYVWYPGWRYWGCSRPRWWWWGSSYNPPEVVMENEVKIGADGTVKIEIDTGVAKEIHGDKDHKYQVTAEVVDESRRTIVGQGNVMVARRPFKVYTWLDRGHYSVGDVIQASFRAQTLDRRGVQGAGALTLFKVAYKDNKPVESAVQTWKLDTNDEGTAALQIKAFKPGQYRLSYKVTDSKKHEIEGGYVFVIRGEGFDGSDFRFNSIELVTDKKEYAPGDTVKLMVNTERQGSTVLLFTRPSNGLYLAPKVLRLTGKSVTEEIKISKKDMPNFFVEALTISNGKLYTEVREIIVPPEKRVLNIKAEPSKTEYKPGEKASVKLTLTELSGKPFVGSLALTVYDKSVEYISGGSNVPEIKAFFWKWRRRHYPRSECSLNRWLRNVVRSGVLTMQYLGVFGYSVADQTDLEGGESKGKPEEKEQMKQLASDGSPPAPMVTRAAGAAKNANGRRRESLRASDKGGAPGFGGGGQGAEAGVKPTIRKTFADTALWVAALTTDKTGSATVNLTMPENLTGWKIKVWGMGHGTKVGQAETEVVTAKKLLLRMQAPRFFVEKDEVVLSANVHNYLKAKKTVTAVLELDGDCLKPMGQFQQKVTVGSNGEERVDWRVKVVKEGTAVVRMKALTDVESDAVEMKFPVYVHGMLKTESWSGALRPADESGVITLTVPKERRIEQSRLEIRYSPTLAGAMVDALPYLVDYPHKTSDCELNRILPTVMTQKILLDMKLDLKAIQAKRTNLNAQEIGDDKERAKQWKRWDRNPVFDVDEVNDMVKAGVRKLTAMQLSDGGWGWFSGWGERSSAHTTAYVVHGLQIAKANDVALVPGMLDRGVKWLTRYQDRQVQLIKNHPKYPSKQFADNMDAFVFMVLTDAGVKNTDMLGFLYRDRTKLAVYAKAMFGLALHKLGEKEKLAMVVRNIDQFLMQDDENQTAYLKLPQNNWWWYWYGSEYEAQAYYLKLLCRTDPKGVKASRLVKYLLNNRKHATYWNSPRDTAICVEAFAEYLKASGEDKPDMTVEILLDGKKMKEVKITADNLFTFDNKLVVVGDAVLDGKHKVELRKKGKGPLYFNAYLTNFTLEDFITKAGLEIKVDRTVYKLVKVDKTIKAVGSHGQALDQKVEKYERKPVKNLDTLKSGDLVEIELVIHSKNDYEYIVFEDMKASGFEPVEVRSGYARTGLHAYMELRDERVTFFVRRLARGKHSVSYRLRAEIPGKFSALPTRGYAMYAPELKANSDEIKLKIVD